MYIRKSRNLLMHNKFWVGPDNVHRVSVGNLDLDDCITGGRSYKIKVSIDVEPAGSSLI